MLEHPTAPMASKDRRLTLTKMADEDKQPSAPRTRMGILGEYISAHMMTDDALWSGLLTIYRGCV